MAKTPSSFGSTFNPMKFMSASSGRTIAEKIDKDERAFSQKTKKLQKDRLPITERTKLIETLKSTNTKQSESNVSVEDYINKLFTSSGSDTIDNQRIRKMVPEISQASSFMVSMIISPNDLREGEISIKNDETSLNDDQKRELENYLKEYYEERFNLSTNLPKWIDEALYNSGAKCLLTIPMSAIEKQILKKDISNESFQKVTSSLEKMGSLFGISSESDTDYDRIAGKTITVATESFSDLNQNDSKTFNKSIESIEFKNEWKKLVNSVTSKESIKLSDNPFLLRLSQSQNNIALEKINNTLSSLTSTEAKKVNLNQKVRSNLIKKKLLSKNGKDNRNYLKRNEKKDFDKEPFVQLTHTENDHIGEPLFMEVPTESIIPIFVPGSENETLGYLGVIDENGHFANVSNIKNQFNKLANNRGDRYNFNQIYQAAGFNSNRNGIRSDDAQNVMSKLYQSIVEGYLDEKVRKSGCKNFTIGSNPSVYKYMFTQYLCNKQTNLIYIPSDMLTYFTFNHGPDGRGISDLENIKYSLSQKMNLETSNLISKMNSAIDRKKLNLNVSSNNNKGNILQQIESMQREYMRKNTWSMSSDPRQTANEILEKGLSVKVSGVEGLDYDVTEENNVKEAPPIDEALLDNFKNQIRLGLFVPAAAMNMTGEDEYARSVATSNLFTSNVVMVRQKIVTNKISQFLRTFTKYSPSLRQGIMDIIFTTSEENDYKTENGNIDPNKLSDDNKERLNNVIESISIALPPPNIAPNKAMYEVINDVSGAAENLINSLYPDELVGTDNPSLQLAMQTFKSFCKCKYIQETIDNNGMDTGFIYGLNDLDSTDITDFRQQIANMSKNLLRQIKTMNIDEDNEKVQQSGGDSFGGGMGGSFDSPGGFGDDSGFASNTGENGVNVGDNPEGGF